VQKRLRLHWQGIGATSNKRFKTFFAPSTSPRVIEHRHLLPVTNRSTAGIMVCWYQRRENDQKKQSNVSLCEMAEVFA
jgi:hypothetical protein